MRLTDANVELAHEIIARYPRPKSALIPLLHVAQEQNGHVTDEAMAHIAELVDVTPAEVMGTCTFYEMFKRHETGRYLVNICTSMSCLLMGADDLMHHAEETLGIRPGSTTPDGLITLEGAECQAACSEAPCLQVNYRYAYRLSTDDFDDLIAGLRSGALSGDFPDHGTTTRVRQRTTPDQMAGVFAPEDVNEAPVWLRETSDS